MIKNWKTFTESKLFGKTWDTIKVGDTLLCKKDYYRKDELKEPSAYVGHLALDIQNCYGMICG